MVYITLRARMFDSERNQVSFGVAVTLRFAPCIFSVIHIINNTITPLHDIGYHTFIMIYYETVLKDLTPKLLEAIILH